MSCVPYLQTIRLACALLFLIPGVGVGQVQISDAALEHAKELLRSTPLIDGHNDLPWLIREETGGDVTAFRLEHENDFDTDIPRLRKGLLVRSFGQFGFLAKLLLPIADACNWNRSTPHGESLIPILTHLNWR
ncbi:MAG: hypothetical protein E2O53_08875 [Gammaproteobacteria bacterium]|nr:MAG: hypothetical protein E2O53_08875 [Gammaproteobacteria bacterium]